MDPRSRTRRILKWTGAGLSGVVITAGVLSCWYFVQYRGDSPRPVVNFYRGGVCVEILDGELKQVFVYPNVSVSRLRASLDEIDWLPPLRIEREAVDHAYPNEKLTRVTIELWVVLLFVAIPTVWLWHRDRRRIRPGCCPRCGYDLIGNTSGVCSECGEAKPPPPMG